MLKFFALSSTGRDSFALGLASVKGLCWNVLYLHLIFVPCLDLPLQFLVLAAFKSEKNIWRMGPSRDTCSSPILSLILSFQAFYLLLLGKSKDAAKNQILTFRY